jgi:hypothetical protein
MDSSLGDRIVLLGRTIGRDQYQLIKLVVDFEFSAEWYADGSRTAAHWIATKLDVTVATAREWIRVGRDLRELPVIDSAFADERISYSKVRALTRLATAANEDELCQLAEGIPAGFLGRALAAWSQKNDSDVIRDARQQHDRRMVWSVEPDGMVVVSARLPPSGAGNFMAAIDAVVMGRAARPKVRSLDDQSLFPSLAQQRADALVHIAMSGGVEVSTEVVLHVRADGCTLDDGTPITGSAVERVAPAAFIRALVHDADRRPINASSRQRHPSNRQKRVVKERDRACVDCGATHLLEYDHVPDFGVTKRTVVDELQVRCAPCHRARHAA